MDKLDMERIMPREVLCMDHGDPILTFFFMKYYDKYVAPAVNNLILVQNGYQDPEVREFFQKMVLDDFACSVSLVSTYAPVYLKAFNMGWPCIDNRDGMVLFTESDCFFGGTSLIQRYFDQVESGRYRLISQRHGSYNGYDFLFRDYLEKFDKRIIDSGLTFDPGLTVARTEDINNTRLRFLAESFEPGEILPGTGQPAPHGELCVGDTMVSMSLDLRFNGLKQKDVYYKKYAGHHAQGFPGYFEMAEGNPYLIEYTDEEVNDYYVSKRKAGFIHAGSLSSFYYKINLAEDGRTLNHFKSYYLPEDYVVDINDGSLSQDSVQFGELVKFCGMGRYMAKVFEKEYPDKLSWYVDGLYRGIDSYTKAYNLKSDGIDLYEEHFRQVVEVDHRKKGYSEVI